MTDAHIPLPTNEQLTERELKLLKGLPEANVFRMVANTSASLKPFLDFAGSVLLQNKFDRRLRQLAILRVIAILGSEYARVQHERISKVVGVPEQDIVTANTPGSTEGRDEETLLVLEAAEDITRNIKLRSDLLERLLERYGREQTTEFVLAISFYNLIPRFLESARVPLESEALL